MVSDLFNCFKLKNFGFGNRDEDNEGFDDEAESSSAVPDPCLWMGVNLERHSFGDFSFAAIQANQVVEDYGQVETGYGATFAGVYDGHGGHQCAQYISEHLFNHLTRIIQERGTISEEVLRNAFAATEEGFLGVVQSEFATNRIIASHGSCCLVGVIWNNTIYIANAGDSRAVLGCAKKKKIIAHDLNSEHNAKHEEVREELKAANPDDNDIVLKKSGQWRVKGLIQVSKSIGDAYLKRPEYAFDESYPRFHLPTPIARPLISAEPSLLKRTIQPQDRFLIFASDGLWDYLSSQEAAEVVHKYPRAGIARRLIRRVMNRIARLANGTYEQIKRHAPGDRRQIHDDITVVVIFINHDLLQTSTPEPQLSVRAFGGMAASSGFNVLQALNASTSNQPSA